MISNKEEWEERTKEETEKENGKEKIFEEKKQ